MSQHKAGLASCLERTSCCTRTSRTNQDSTLRESCFDIALMSVSLWRNGYDSLSEQWGLSFESGSMLVSFGKPIIIP